MPAGIIHKAAKISACEKGPEAEKALKRVQAMQPRRRMPESPKAEAGAALEGLWRGQAAEAGGALEGVPAMQPRCRTPAGIIPKVREDQRS